MGIEATISSLYRLLWRATGYVDELEEHLAEGAGMDELRELRTHLNRLESDLDDLSELPGMEDGSAIKECLEYGLMTIEARYGLNSGEHQACRTCINAL